MGISAASARNSRASSRVKFATERSTRSRHSRSYENAGMPSRWMALIATVPAGPTAASADTTTDPAGANVTAASSGSGGGSSYPPTHTAPSSRARSCSAGERENTNTSQPQWRATWIARWADDPNPKSPRRPPGSTPLSRSDR